MLTASQSMVTGNGHEQVKPLQGHYGSDQY